MNFVYNDGGRRASGFKRHGGDCVVRAVAIATKQDYKYVYKLCSIFNAAQRGTMSASNGVPLTRAFHKWMTNMGWEYKHCGDTPFDTPSAGTFILHTDKHYTAVIDGVVHDTFNLFNTFVEVPILGYWVKK
jgi:hypothetical protein